MDNLEKEIFDKTQEKQAKLAKKLMLCIFCGMGAVFAVLGLVFLIASMPMELSIVFVAVGIFLMILGIILHFVIPTKYNYERYKAYTEKFGIMNVYEMNAKLFELEARIEILENENKE